MNLSSTQSVNRRNALICTAMLLVFALVTLIGVLNHELWFDEAQAWVIARDATINNFADILKHEGHPALWYLVLMPFAKLGAPCEALNIVSWFCSLMSAGLLLWKAPLGLWVKAAVLFSSGYLYFNSVNARVYCIIPVLLYLTAIVYPKRKKLAPLFGLLVGLIANTHIMMCGLVGIFGIFMIIELFQSVKQNGWKKSAGSIIGLAIAGILVLCMILPLIGSISVNNMMDGKTISVGTVAYGMFSVNTDIGQYLTSYPFRGINALLGTILGVVLTIYIICLFSYRKAFISSLVFTLMYGGLIGGLWYTTQLRAPVFVYTLLTIFWIVLQSDMPLLFRFPENSSNRLTKFIEKFFNNPAKICTALLFIVLVGSIPAGVYWLATDIAYNTSMTKDASRFIREELPNDAVIIVDGQYCSQFSAYCPETRFYSLELQRFITYCPHEKADGEIDLDKIRTDLEGLDHLYYLSYSQMALNDITEEATAYTGTTDHLPPYGFERSVTIQKFDLESRVAGMSVNP